MLDEQMDEIVRKLPDGEELVLQRLPPKSLADRRERTSEARGPAPDDDDELAERRWP